jgi:hypothetical protein
MKSILLLTFLFFSTQVFSQQVRVKLRTFPISINDSNANRVNNAGIGGTLEYSISGSVLFTVKGVEHIIGTPAAGQGGLPPVHLINKNGTWELENIYPEAAMGNARNYEFIDSSTIAYADHGLESGNPWPFGDIWIAKLINEKLKWTKISKHKSFFHSVSVGDFNNDNRFDIVGMHMGSYNPWKGVGGLQPFIQQVDSTFEEGINIISSSTDSYWKKLTGPGAVKVKDILGDSKPEIIVTSYGNIGLPYGYLIYAYNNQTKTYEYLKKSNELGVFSDTTKGGANSTSIKFADFDKNGIVDMAIAIEGFPGPRIQIWNGLKNGDFTPGQIISHGDTSRGYLDSANSFREFEVADVDNDGWEDIIMHPNNFGNKFRIKPGPGGPHYTDDGWRGYGIMLQYSIWKNTNGKFNHLTNDLSIPNIYPGYIKGFLVNNKLKFFGFQNTQKFPAKQISDLHSFNLYEITVTFCKDLIKPTFNSSKYSFCSGDSLKLSITNVNKGDTLKWYFGTKSDLTNVANKTFTDTTKLFVTRTDSVGCMISSDTIQITKNSIPIAPGISRDSDNNLVANTNSIIWYKDGVKISDTTQKIKPNSNGNYTATTTQNGCTSPVSANYYYITSAVANLTSGEYFKVSPNPTDGEIYLNYNIRSTRDVFISVIDMNGRTIISNRKVNSGSKLNLGSSMKGNYIIKVKDKSGRLLTTEKLIKN